MNILERIVNRYPVWFSLIVMVIATALTEIPLADRLTPALGLQKASYLTGILEQGAVSLLLFLLIARVGLLREGGFTHPREWKAVWLIWPVLVYSLLNGSDVFLGTLKINWANGGLIALCVLLYITVGTVEEFMFRGLVLPLMLRQWGGTRRGTYTAVLLSSAVFGILHLLNFAMGRRDLLTTGTQILYGTFFGVFFAALMLRNRSIWPAVFGHFLFDLCGNLPELTEGWVFSIKEPTTTPQGALITLAILLPLLGIGLFYLRKVEPACGEKRETLPGGVMEAV